MMNEASQGTDREILEELLRNRIVATQEKKDAIEALELLDDEIKIAMITSGIERVESDGMRMKVVQGRNTTIVKDLVIRKLSVDWELDPEQVQEFLRMTSRVKEYDYIDMRKSSAKPDEEGESDEDE